MRKEHFLTDKFIPVLAALAVLWSFTGNSYAAGPASGTVACLQFTFVDQDPPLGNTTITTKFFFSKNTVKGDQFYTFSAVQVDQIAGQNPQVTVGAGHMLGNEFVGTSSFSGNQPDPYTMAGRFVLDYSNPKKPASGSWFMIGTAYTGTGGFLNIYADGTVQVVTCPK